MENLNFVNYHKHSMWTNTIVPDSVETIENYAKRAVELNQKVLSTVEHGWQGFFINSYEMAKKYNLKMLYGVEAYWVKDRLATYDDNGNLDDNGKKDKTNNHIVLLARNENGRRAINRILSQSAKDGFYYRTRIDVNQILSLPPNDVWVTSACIAYNGYGFEETFRITQDFAEHFGNNFFLEVQYHNTDSQKQWNKMLLDWSKLLNCKIIMGCDSHYVSSDNAWERTDYLKSKGIEYPQEENWYLDYPDVETAIKRFKIQGVLSDEEIYEAINNTNIFEQVEEYDCPIFNTDIKMPTLYPNLSKKEKNLKLATLVHDNWLKEREKIPKEQWKHYEDEIKRELQTIIDVDHADYFLLYYEGIKHGVELGGVITPSGRGSAVSSYCNKLLGLTKVDRISSIVPLFFERFMSKSRMLEARTLADIDCNITDRDIFIKAFIDLFGEKHCVPMVAFGTMKVKAAWQMYAKSAEIPFEIANAVSKQIEEYETYVKYHSDENEEPPSVFDFIDEQYHETFQKSRKYLGIISDWKIAPSAVLVYNGDIEEEIGLVRCKDNVCCIVDKVWGDDYKFLKLDLLKVSSIQLIYRVFNRLGIKNEDVPDTNELLKLVAQDDKTWDIYKNGYVMGINQVEQEGAMKKIMRYQPHSISDLSSFIAAIRPGFKSMYNIFESREPFSYNIPSIDNLIQTKESPYSFILYQENIMQILSYAGIPMDNTYEIVKAISKKKKEKILKHKDHFMEGFVKRLISEESYTEQSAIDIGNRVWQIIEDSSSYSFNACVSGDTIIHLPSGNCRHKPLTVEEMYLSMNDKKWAENNGHKHLSQKYRYQGYPKSLSLYDDNKLRTNKIKDIRIAGIRDIYRVTLENGSYIDCTMNHKFPTPKGQYKLEQLSVGDKLYCKDVYHKNKNYVHNFTNNDFESNVPKLGQRGFQKKPNGASVIYDNYRKECIENKCKCEECGCEYDGIKRFELHHIDGDSTNNNKSNYKWVCVNCHKKIHYRSGRTKAFEKGIDVITSKITSIEFLRTDQTYDVEMEHPYHTFVVSTGIVTCNSHSYSMAFDSLYGAYLKAHYPLEFYEVFLNLLMERGEKDRSIKTKEEAKRAFGIEIVPFKFRQDNRKFSVIDDHSIADCLSNIKGFGDNVAEELYKLKDNQYNSFIELLDDICNNTTINKTQIENLIVLHYFDEFGLNKKLYGFWRYYQKLRNINIVKKDNLDKIGINKDLIVKYSTKETEKQYSGIDNVGLLTDIWNQLPNKCLNLKQQVNFEKEILGYIKSVYSDAPETWYLVQSKKIYKNPLKPYIVLYNLKTGETISGKINNDNLFSEQPFNEGNVFNAIAYKYQNKSKKVGDAWIKTDEKEIVITNYELIG